MIRLTPLNTVSAPSLRLNPMKKLLFGPVGVPDSRPLALSVMPAGSVPVGVHVTLPAFPSAVS